MRANEVGWGSPEIVGSLVAGSVLLALFVLWELRARAPMLPMRFFRNRAFTLTNVASLFMFFGMFGSIFLLAQFFQTVQGYSPLAGGRPDPPVDGDADLHRADRRSPLRPDRRPADHGRRAHAAGDRPGLDRDRLDADRRRTASSSIPFFISGIGMALFFAPVANVVLSAVRRQEEGQASGATNAIRELGGVFGVAVLASIFAHYGGYLSGQDFVDGMRPAVWVGAAVVGLGAVAAFLVPSPARVQGRGPGDGARPGRLGRTETRPGDEARSSDRLYGARNVSQASCMRAAWPAVNSV